MDVPSVEVFVEVLKSETRWYTFGVFLSIPSQDLELICNSGTQSIETCLISLYENLNQRGEMCSWGVIADVLRKMNNIRLAETVYRDHILPAASRSTPSMYPIDEESTSVRKRKDHPDESVDECASSSIGFVSGKGYNDSQVENARYVLKNYNEICGKFSLIVFHIKRALDKSNISARDILVWLNEPEPLEDDYASIDSIFTRVQFRCCVFYYDILVKLTDRFLTGERAIQQLINDFKASVEHFKRSTTLRMLMNLMNEKRSNAEECSIVQVKLREFWIDMQLEKLDLLMCQVLSEDLYDQISCIRVEKNSGLYVSWHMPNYVAITPREFNDSLEFIKLIGIVSLHIGDDEIYSIPGEACEVIEAAMLQAIELKNSRAVEVLLAIGFDPEAATYKRENCTSIMNIGNNIRAVGCRNHVCVFGEDQNVVAILDPSTKEEQNAKQKMYRVTLHENESLKKKLKEKGLVNNHTYAYATQLVSFFF